MPEIMIAVRPGTVYLDGSRRMVRKGRTTAHSDHPIVTQHPKLWAPLKVDYASPEPVYEDDAFGGTPEAPAVPPQPPAAAAEVDNTAVRQWGADNGIEVKRGKIPQAVIDQYRAAVAAKANDAD
jgi:hypothetical protein